MRHLLLTGLLVAAPVFAAQDYEISLDLTVDGVSLEPAAVTVADGGSASITVEHDRHIVVELSATSADRNAGGKELVAIAARISEVRDGHTVELGAPKILAAIGEPASIAVGDPATGTGGYKLQLVAARSP